SWPRSEPAPASARLVTVSVLSRLRSSSASSRGAKDRRGADRFAGWGRSRRRYRVENNMIRSFHKEEVCDIMRRQRVGRADRAPGGGGRGGGAGALRSR